MKLTTQNYCKQSSVKNQIDDNNDEYLQDIFHKLATNARHLRIAMNVRGLKNKVDELRILLKLCRFDVFGVTETCTFKKRIRSVMEK